ncbi:HAD-IIB family hydrolase [Coraliomargarita sp. SDUM461004]|uniref:HAD-IIB family hydrolase n=1 Tax=Thalassobacterium sedimentorum TaxID=3041258 RepID=A0ABU1AG32_9BACT|nr:HAD-IIB family hydrolase [Coraliomargarita sp. SDUM461004]MDQ8193756.1 HAD-IIB family hydrolase [Coraliomargarita sp. SDUM461004]
MNVFNPQPEVTPSVLATDLDGTLIPLPDSETHHIDLKYIAECFADSKVQLVYATGRHYESVVEAMRTYNLPTPEWIICDVGSSIYQRTDNTFRVFETYESHLLKNSDGLDRQIIEEALGAIEGLIPQASEHQRRFKISYQSSAQALEALVEQVTQKLLAAQLPYDCMGSLDPFLNCGLIDVMPTGVSKAYALLWLSTHADFTPDQVVYAGDSGNDYAALISGFRAIIVANGSQGLVKKVSTHLSQRNLSDRLYVAHASATSGVLEGCRHYGLL